MMPVRRFVLLAAVVILGGAPPAEGAASNVPLRCGDTITHDTRLTANLTSCAGTGLVIAADGVTLDLAGHRIADDGSRDGVGIDIEGHNGVTVENGTVRGFAEGVFASGARDIAIRHLTTTQAAHGGIMVDGVLRVRISGNTARRCGSGIIIARAHGVHVHANRVSASVFGGIPVFDSRHVVISENFVTTSRTDMAIGLVRGSSHSVVVGNRVARSGAGIVLADGAAHNVVAANIARRDDSGVVLDVGTHDNRVAHNRISRSSFEGIAVVGSDRNVIRRNRVARSGTREPAGGIAVIPLPDDISQTSDGNLLAWNLAVHNAGAGILVGAGQAANVLRADRAVHNTQLGIDATAGTVDGGRNRAAHNGDPRQCVGVVCTA